MKYEKKYKKALKRAKYYKEGITDRKLEEGENIMDYIFPELNEIEDEKVKRSLIELVNQSSEVLDRQNQDNMIAWLEKQGSPVLSNSSNIGKNSQKPIISNNALREGMSHFGITQYQIDNLLKKYVDVEKQSEHRLFYNIKPKFKVGDVIHRIGENTLYPITIQRITDDNETYVGNNEKVFITIKFQDEYELVNQKPTDNVAQKIHIEKGNWYVCIQTFNLNCNTVVEKGRTYKSQENNVISGENNRLFIDKHDGDVSKYFRPWTIQDAKDGNVLVTDNDLALIYNGYLEEQQWPFAYGGINIYGRFNTCDGLLPFTHQNVVPATKEQRELLFAKMKEAGYEWDADKKELKKIDSKVDFYMSDRKKAYEIAWETSKHYDPNGCKQEWCEMAAMDMARWKNRQKPAWSDEDESNFLKAIYVCHQYEYFEVETWLKNLKNRITITQLKKV